MGYRLNVENESKTLCFYGTKHYGYLLHDKEDGIDYPSYRYLLKLKKITGEEYFDYCLDFEITLTAKQFEHFIKLYSKEWETDNNLYKNYKGTYLLQQPEIKALLQSKEKKILSWI